MKVFGQNWPVFQYEVCCVLGLTITKCDASWRVGTWKFNCGGLGQWIPGDCRLRMRLRLRVEARLMRHSGD